MKDEPIFIKDWKKLSKKEKKEARFVGLICDKKFISILDNLEYFIYLNKDDRFCAIDSPKKLKTFWDFIIKLKKIGKKKK